MFFSLLWRNKLRTISLIKLHWLPAWPLDGIFFFFTKLNWTSCIHPLIEVSTLLTTCRGQFNSIQLNLDVELINTLSLCWKWTTKNILWLWYGDESYAIRSIQLNYSECSEFNIDILCTYLAFRLLTLKSEVKTRVAVRQGLMQVHLHYLHCLLCLFPTYSAAGTTLKRD